MPAPRIAFEIDETEHLWIPMPDGVRLAARCWLPRGAGPVPALFEYIPYRKADMVRARDERNHPFFAAHGYACLRVDMRGSGDSEGHMPDMYDPLELSDARHVIDWIAAQPWCDGQVGMFGTSWGGTAALQANIDAPDALKAVIAVCATHDRYEDDIHHMGGCVLTDTLEWGATLPVILAAPPTPNVGPDWMDLWQKRLDRITLPVEAWLREEARGEYWLHGSVIHQADRLSRPILAVGGWADRYSNSVMTLAAARPDLVWGVVGPWGHHYPDYGHPGPAIGFQQMALDWFDRWMKPQGSAPELPRLRLWMREFDLPTNALDRRNGRWIEADAAQPATHVLNLGAEGLTQAQLQSLGDWPVPCDLAVGQASGDTGYFGRFGGLPLDQTEDDARALVFETDPMAQDLNLLGVPSLVLNVGAGASRGQVLARLVDVAPDGSAARIGWALRNLALDEQFDAPIAPLSERDRQIEIAFPTTAYRLQKDHRLRLAISASYWPLVWPSPFTEGPQIVAGRLCLPVCASPPQALHAPMPDVRDLPERKSHHCLSNPPLERLADAEDGVLQNGWTQSFAETHFSQIETDFGYETQARHQIALADPLSAQSEFIHRQRYRRPDGTAEIACTLAMTSDSTAYRLQAHLRVDWQGQTLLDRQWDQAVSRCLG